MRKKTRKTRTVKKAVETIAMDQPVVAAGPIVFDETPEMKVVVRPTPGTVGDVALIEAPPEHPEIHGPGISCPRCRFTMRVYRTKKLTGEVARERICDRCGEKQDTEEVPIN